MKPGWNGIVLDFTDDTQRPSRRIGEEPLAPRPSLPMSQSPSTNLTELPQRTTEQHQRTFKQSAASAAENCGEPVGGLAAGNTYNITMNFEETHPRHQQLDSEAARQKRQVGERCGSTHDGALLAH